MLVTRTERHLFTDGSTRHRLGRKLEDFVFMWCAISFESLTRAIKRARLRIIGVESSRVSYEFMAQLKGRLPELEVVLQNATLWRAFASAKPTMEKEKIGEAAAIASTACRKIVAGGLVGKRETEVAGELEALFRNAGAEGIAFDTM